jgi:hypothetical protein
VLTPVVLVDVEVVEKLVEVVVVGPTVVVVVEVVEVNVGICAITASGFTVEKNVAATASRRMKANTKEPFERLNRATSATGRDLTLLSLLATRKHPMKAAR